jgi:hypothetical protein
MHQKDRPVPPDVPFLVKGPSFAAGMPEEPEVARFRTAIVLRLLDREVRRRRYPRQGPDRPDRNSQASVGHVHRGVGSARRAEPDPPSRRVPPRAGREQHPGPDDRRTSNIQDRTIDELANGETAELWKACDRCNFFELRPTICAYDLDHFDKPFVRHADLALPVRDTDSAILIYGYSWLL